MKGKHSKSKWKGLLFAMLWTMSLGVFAQNVDVHGTVTDETGETVIGATIIVEGSVGVGTTTDIDGNYTLNNVPANGNLVFSYVGLATQTIAVNGRTTIDVVMASDTELLDEVVVVGFGTQRKVNLTGAVASVDTKALESRPVSSAVQALQGVVPGLNINVSNQGNRLDANPSMNIRGTGNLGTGSSASPLILIDGVEGSLNNINPQDIASISVLKDAASAAIYGSRAPFGVVLVTTKSGQRGKVTTTYSNNFRWTRPTNIPDMLDSYRFAQYFNVGQANAGRTNPLFPDDVMERIRQYMAGEITETANPNESQG
ncbi:MAG: TonB-dependent receptor plug domain-containing protein, partial [Bacteroidia bacterium]|nr:TonB-dependent receptor plug domain-containing protein [Bacteroidia bacterium]